MPNNQQHDNAFANAPPITGSMHQVYSQRVRELALDIPLVGKLANPDRSATAKSRICGSSISVDLNLSGERVIDFRQTVRACMLGCCSASIFARNIIECTYHEVFSVREQLQRMLQCDGNPPAGNWSELDLFQFAISEKARHASILLVFDATISAFNK